MKSLLFVIALAMGPAAIADTTTLNFNEFGSAIPIDAASVTDLGVTFLFSGGTSIYNYNLGGGTVLVSDPALAGPTSGILTLDFAHPTYILAFDLALESAEAIRGAYTVTLGANSSPEDTAPIDFFSEGHYSYAGSTPLTSAVITFDSSAAPDFALDNLTFETETPEPRTAGLIGLILVAWAPQPSVAAIHVRNRELPDHQFGRRARLAADSLGGRSLIHGDFQVARAAHDQENLSGARFGIVVGQDLDLAGAEVHGEILLFQVGEAVDVEVGNDIPETVDFQHAAGPGAFAGALGF